MSEQEKVLPGPGTRAIDVIRAKSVLERRKLEVPEWGLTFWFGKVTVDDMEAVDNRRDENGQISRQERNLIMLVSKAQAEDGTPMFTMGDVHFLKKEADFVVLQRVINFMFESAYTSLKDVKEKKEAIAANPPSASGSS